MLRSLVGSEMCIRDSLITITRRCKHITPILQQLHWLPVHQRVQFKFVVLMYRHCTTSCLHTWQKIANLCLTGHRRLHSSDTNTCLVQRTNTRFGDHSFAVAGPRVWNSLPTQLCVRHYTRTILTSTQNASIWSLTAAAPSNSVFRALCINWLTYLLTYLHH